MADTRMTVIPSFAWSEGDADDSNRHDHASGADAASPSSLVHTPTAHRMGIAPSYLLHPMALGSFAA